jgi:triphosphoribosyl-dephospho-CoA synthetase
MPRIFNKTIEKFDNLKEKVKEKVNNVSNAVDDKLGVTPGNKAKRKLALIGAAGVIASPVLLAAAAVAAPVFGVKKAIERRDDIIDGVKNAGKRVKKGVKKGVKNAGVNVPIAAAAALDYAVGKPAKKIGGLGKKIKNWRNKMKERKADKQSQRSI